MCLSHRPNSMKLILVSESFWGPEQRWTTKGSWDLWHLGPRNLIEILILSQV